MELVGGRCWLGVELKLFETLLEEVNGWSVGRSLVHPFQALLISFSCFGYHKEEKNGCF